MGLSLPTADATPFNGTGPAAYLPRIVQIAQSRFCSA